jgi:hypothetical protein
VARLWKHKYESKLVKFAILHFTYLFCFFTCCFVCLLVVVQASSMDVSRLEQGERVLLHALLHQDPNCEKWKQVQLTLNAKSGVNDDDAMSASNGISDGRPDGNKKAKVTRRPRRPQRHHWSWWMKSSTRCWSRPPQTTRSVGKGTK